MMKAFFPIVFAANAMVAIHVIAALAGGGALTAFGG